MESASIRGGSPLVPAFAVSIALLFAACGGGGGGGGPAATFSFTAAGASASEGGANLDVQVVLHTTQSALAAPASVDVVDLGTGTATSGTDYAAFAPQTLTFPIGAMDGDVQSVAVSALDDAEIEGAPETVRLGLANPAGGALAGASAFAVGIDDADQATIEFASASSTAPDESATPRNVSIVLELPAGTSLAVAAGVRLSDDGAGSATSGADYDAIPQQTIAFAAGSLDGATQTIAVNVNDDATPELDETVELALASPTAGTVVGGTDLHTLTITDDENQLPPAFVASEGATGVENPLAYDELVDLGSQGVGDGPNAGTLVRVTNVGGSAMDLGAPRLTGTNANDFVVEIESAPLPPPAPETDVAAPIVRLPTAAGPGIAFRFEPAGLRELRALPRAKVHGFPVPGLGDLTLELARLPLPIAAGAVLRVDGVDVPGGLAAAVGDLSVWSGSIVEVPGSHVFLALSSAGSRGFLEMPFPGNRVVHLVTEAGASGAQGACRLVRDADLQAALATAPGEFCAEPRAVPGQMPQIEPSARSPYGPEELTAAVCDIAIETDYELYQQFNSVPATTAYVTQMMAAISDRYFTDVQTTLSIAYLGLYTTAADPWSGTDSNARLDEFRAAWAPNNWPAVANLAHFVSGANLGGGVAYLNALCDQSFGFGVSGNIGGDIDWSGWTGQPGNFTWDFVVVAHELGHNFGANHTHSYCPPLDQCYTNCAGPTVCSQGTLMSYCHLCGGMDNIDLEFGPMIANIMRTAVNSSCLGLSSLAAGDHVQYLVRFAPWGATGTRTAALQFTHDAPNATQPFRIQLQGSAQP